MTDIIYLERGNSYQIFENYLYDLYSAQVDEEGHCNYCMDDLLVVWGLAYDLADLEKMLETGGSSYPTLFEHDPTDDERREQHRIFFNVDDWCEGERWAAVFAVYSLSEIYHDPSINGFKGRPMKLLGRDDRGVKG